MIARQPVHTVYGGAHLFRHDVAAKLGRIAMAALEAHGSLLPVTPEVLERVGAKLRHEPVEDLRIDFEDGYGARSDAEEDSHALQAAKEVALGVERGTLPPFAGIRVKSFGATRHRAMRTLRLFFENCPTLPETFCVVLPKIRQVEEVHAFCRALYDLDVTAPVELMIETPQSLAAIREMVDATEGRCRGAHFGPYDFTSSCGVTTQNLRHALCIHARNEMLIRLAGNGIWLSDGPTTVVPVGSVEDIRQAWTLSWNNISEALHDGFPQGWDVHPAQLPVRYAAVYSYFAHYLPAAVARYRNFMEQSEQATRVGSVFDDAASVLILRNLFQQAVACGAVTAEELQSRHGVSLA